MRSHLFVSHQGGVLSEGSESLSFWLVSVLIFSYLYNVNYVVVCYVCCKPVAILDLTYRGGQVGNSMTIVE